MHDVENLLKRGMAITDELNAVDFALSETPAVTAEEAIMKFVVADQLEFSEHNTEALLASFLADVDRLIGAGSDFVVVA